MYPESYLVAFDRVIGSEGGFTDDPNDRGNWTSGVIGQGELRGTKFGISAMSYPNLDIKNLTPDDAREIYYNDFWLKNNIDRLPEVLSYPVFDSAVNAGRNGTKLLQKALNEFGAGLSTDGIIGNSTLNSIEDLSSDQVIQLLMIFYSLKIRYYTSLDSFSRYGKGWVNRVAENLKSSAIDLSK